MSRQWDDLGGYNGRPLRYHSYDAKCVRLSGTALCFIVRFGSADRSWKGPYKLLIGRITLGSSRSAILTYMLLKVPWNRYYFRTLFHSRVSRQLVFRFVLSGFWRMRAPRVTSRAPRGWASRIQLHIKRQTNASYKLQARIRASERLTILTQGGSAGGRQENSRLIS
jgi:hypothetical protein